MYLLESVREKLKSKLASSGIDQCACVPPSMCPRCRLELELCDMRVCCIEATLYNQSLLALMRQFSYVLIMQYLFDFSFYLLILFIYIWLINAYLFRMCPGWRMYLGMYIVTFSTDIIFIHNIVVASMW